MSLKWSTSIRIRLAWRELRGLLRDAGVSVCEQAELDAADREWLEGYFMDRVFPVLTPLAVDPAHPFPFISNLSLCMVLKLVREEDGGTMRALPALLVLGSTPRGAEHAGEQRVGRIARQREVLHIPRRAAEAPVRRAG